MGNYAMKKADIFRFANTDKHLETNKTTIYEYIILDLLEKMYNWKGICVEPIPKRFKLLCENRPNSLCYDYAVYSESNKEVFFDIAHTCDLLSGMSNYIDCHKNTVDTNKTQIIVTTIF